MNSDRLLWGVLFTGSMPDDKPMLLWQGWMHPALQCRYEGEPSRPILFRTRELAREWCGAKSAEYSGRSDVCGKWKFRPCRVLESFIVVSNAKLTGVPPTDATKGG